MLADFGGVRIFSFKSTFSCLPDLCCESLFEGVKEPLARLATGVAFRITITIEVDDPTRLLFGLGEFGFDC